MTKLQAHRGVSAEYPENTMVAFRAAVEQGYALIELDPKYTADGKIVLLHDRSLKRTARDGAGNGVDLPIAEITLAQAREYEYGSWFDGKFKGEPLPTLEDVLDFSEKNPQVPLKFDNVWNHFPPQIRTDFLREIGARGDRVNVGLTCASLQALAEGAEALPHAALHYDGADLREETLQKAAEIGKGHKLVFWICYDTPATRWFRGERACTELCDRVRKYGEIGFWLLAEREELREAICVFRADYVETNGKLKPQWVEEILR